MGSVELIESEECECEEEREEEEEEEKKEEERWLQVKTRTPHLGCGGKTKSLPLGALQGAQ